MIKEVVAKEINAWKETEELFKKLVQEFNEISKSKGMKFKLGLDSTNMRAKLYKSILFGFGDSLGNTEIQYREKENPESVDYFYFFGGINSKVFEEIKPILEALKQEFKVEVIKEDK